MFFKLYQVLREKIINMPNESNITFTKEEKTIISNRKDMQELFVDVLEKTPSLIKNDEIITIIQLVDNIRNIIFNHKVVDLFKNLIEYFYERGTLSVETLDVFCSQANLDDNYRRLMRNKMISLYHSPDANDKILIIDEIQIEELFECGRYDVIANIKGELEISKNLILKLKNTWPKNKKMPAFLLKQIYPNDLNYLSYETIINKITISSLDDESKEYIKILENKLTNDLNVGIIKIKPYIQYLLYKRLMDNKKEDIIDLLYKKHILKFKEINTESIIYIIENSYDDELEQIIDLLIENRNNEEIIDTIIDLEKYYLIEQLELKFNKYENTILKKIMYKKELHKLNHEEYKCETYYLINNFPTSIKKKIMDNMKIQTLICNNYYDDDYRDVLEYDEYLFEIETIIEKNPQVTVKCFTEPKIDSKCFELLLKYNKLNFEMYSAEMLMDSKIIKKYISNNYLLADYILSEINYFEENDFLTFIGTNVELSEIAYDKMIEYYINDMPPFNIVKRIVYNKINIYSSVSMDKLEKLYDLIGDKLISLLDNQNIMRILNYSEDIFQKFVSLFSIKNYTMPDLEASYDSIKQFLFASDNSDIINMYVNLCKAIDNNDKDSIDKIINIIVSTLSLENVNKSIGNNSKIDIKELLYFLVENIEHYSETLHLIIDKCIAISRENYRKEYMKNMPNELNLPGEYNQKDYDDEFNRCFIMEFYNNFDSDDIQWEYFKVNLLKERLDLVIVKEALEYFLYGIQPKKSNIKEIGKYLKKIKTLAIEGQINNPFFESKDYYIDRVISKMDMSRVRIEYKFNYRRNNFGELFELLDLDKLEKEVLSDDKVYKSLLKLLKTKKIYLIPECIKSLALNPDINIKIDDNNIAYFISNYGTLLKYYKQFNFIDIIMAASIYSSTSSFYSAILTPENERLLRLETRIFKTYTKNKEQRLEHAVDLTVQMFLRNKITIPSFTDKINLGEKEICVSVGNFTDPSNVTHGERTNSCMKIDGMGYDFLKFCSLNKNGFHIRFNDDNNRYISRVSGFRNGNTIFLNELRNSCLNNYNSKDLLDALIITANRIIEESQNSEYPIDNIVISNQYGLKKTLLKKVNFNIKDCREGYPKFHCDIRDKGVLLASSNNDELVPIKLEQDNLPIYMPARNHYNEYENEMTFKSIENIVRIDMIKKRIYNQPLDIISLPKMKYSVVGDDWYIYIDENEELHYDYIDIDKRAYEEMNQCLQKLKKEENIHLL